MIDHKLNRIQALSRGCTAAALAGLVVVGGCKLEGTAGGAVDDRPEFQKPAAGTPFTPATPAPTTRRVVVLHTNDEHSHLLGFAPNNVYPFRPAFVNGEFSGPATAVQVATAVATQSDKQTEGGVVRRQYLINKERAAAAAAGDPVLLLSGGDVMMGTVFHAAYAAGQAPDYLAMAVLGYDFVTLGNHEFDFGADILARAIGSIHQTTFGSAVPILASNIHFDDVGQAGAGAGLKSLYGAGDSGAPIMPWATKRLANGLKVGFLGLVGYDAALVAPFKTPIFFSTPRGGAVCSAAAPCAGLDSCLGGRCVNPLDFQAHIQAMAMETQAVVDRLRDEQKVDVVIALTHLGENEDEALATLTTGIDVIIGGHSHSVVEARKVSDTIITQAGSYGRLLGRLVLTVAPDGTVDFVDAESELLKTDHTLDAQIYGDTDLTMAKLSKDLERALTLTGGVIAPVLQALDRALAPALGLTSLLQEVVSSDHDIEGEVSNADTKLSHLVTDSIRLSYLASTCHLEAGGPPVVSVQANGVIRESLRFSKTGTSSNSTGTATFADVFRVVPLGVSPFEGARAAPGYPVVAFTVSAIELLAGLDVGVTTGLQSDSFFLSYSGMRTEYNRNRMPFDPQAANPIATGRITKMELSDGVGGYWTLYDANAADPRVAFTNAAGSPVDPRQFYVTVVTNLYLAGFLERFGITPRDMAGAPLAGTGLARLSQTALCHTGMPKNCAAGSVAMVNCTLAGGGPPWPVAPEVKEWQVLYGFLARGLGGRIPSNAYRGETVAPALLRVRDVTP